MSMLGSARVLNVSKVSNRDKNPLIGPDGKPTGDRARLETKVNRVCNGDKVATVRADERTYQQTLSVFRNRRKKPLASLSVCCYFPAI